MSRVVPAVLIAIAVATSALAQDRPAAGMNREQNAPGAAGPKDRGVVQRGEQPNPGEVRPGRRILGLPVDAALLIAGLVIVLAVIAGVVIPGARRRDRARGGGTYGGAGRRD